MSETETTNFLLLLILIVVLAGFGFLAPILWVLVGILCLWLLLKIYGAAVSSVGKIVDTAENYLGRIFSPVWRLLRAFFGNDIVQWGLILGATTLAALSSFITQKAEFLVAIPILAVFALIKAINRWDTVMINRKYKRDDQKDA